MGRGRDEGKAGWLKDLRLIRKKTAILSRLRDAPMSGRVKFLAQSAEAGGQKTVPLESLEDLHWDGQN